MDIIPSVVTAAGLYGLSSGHAFVALAQILQETCMKIQAATMDNTVLLAVTVSRRGVPGGMLLYGSGQADGTPLERPSLETEGALAVGIDSICSAFCRLHEERRKASRRGASNGREAARTGGDTGSPDAAAPPAEITSAGAAGTAAGTVYGGTVADGAEQAGAARGCAELGGGGSEDEEAWVDSILDEDPRKGGRLGNSGNAGLPQSLAFSPPLSKPDGTDRTPSVADGGPAGPAAASAGAGDGFNAALPSEVDAAAAASSSLGGPPSAPASACESPSGGEFAGARAAGRTAGSSASTATEAVGQTQEYELSDDFLLPGLTVAPARTLLPSGRGRSRVPAPAAVSLDVMLPDALVLETEGELRMRHRDNTFRNRLLEFVGLYKFVVDTMVKRKKPDAAARVKVDHHYYQLTPVVARGATVRFKIRGGDVCFVSPMFKNTKFMTNDEYLLIIVLMKFQRDPFFLWLLGLFSGGALAPAVPADPSSRDGAKGPITPAASGKKGKKRQRASPKGSPAENATAGKGRSKIAAVGAGEEQPGGAAKGGSGVARGGSGGRDNEAGAGAGGERPGGAASPSRGAAARGGMGGPAADGAPRHVGPGGGEWPRGPFVDAGRALEARVGARHLLLDGRVLATAQLLVDLTMFHGVDAPATVSTVLISKIESGCEQASYPFGTDAQLCLEKGYPSATLVALGSIAPGYRAAWPVASIG